MNTVTNTLDWAGVDSEEWAIRTVQARICEYLEAVTCASFNDIRREVYTQWGAVSEDYLDHLLHDLETRDLITCYLDDSDDFCEGVYWESGSYLELQQELAALANLI